MTIAIDFDGVIHQYSKGWYKGEIYDPPVKGTREAITKLKNEGHKIIIFSVRTNKIYHQGEGQLQLMRNWLAEHNIPYDKIWNYGKPIADVYIDDRAVTFRGNWEQTLNDISGFTPWWNDLE
jgi:hypothetical protein